MVRGAVCGVQNPQKRTEVVPLPQLHRVAIALSDASSTVPQETYQLVTFITQHSRGPNKKRSVLQRCYVGRPAI